MRVALSLISIGFLSVLVGCGEKPQEIQSDQLDMSIVSGTRVTKADYVLNATVGVVMGEGFCSGVLIAPQVVLTAGHCFDENSGSTEVAFGQSLRGAEKRKVSSIRVYPGWCPKCTDPKVSRHDLAVLKLEAPAPAGYPTATLNGGALVPGEKFYAAGFGSLSRATGSSLGSFDDNSYLHKTILEVIHRRNSTEVFSRGPIKEVKKRNGKPDKVVRYKTSICSGDSGGPAFVIRNNQLFLWGIASGVTKKNQCRDGSYHTDLASYHAWIKNVIEEFGL